jgi:hypothetical protein
VTGTVGSTTPVSPNGCRDTTVIADTTTQTATTPSTPTVTALDQAVQDQRSRDGASADTVPSCSSRTHSTTCVSYAMSKSRRATAQSASGGSELLGFDGFVAPASFRGEDQPDAAGVILVLGRGWSSRSPSLVTSKSLRGPVSGVVSRPVRWSTSPVSSATPFAYSWRY